MKIYPKYSLSENEIKTIYSSCQTVKTGCCSNKTAGPVTFPRDTAIDYQSGKLIFNTFFPCHCLAFLRMVPTAEMTVVLVPLAVVVTETTPGRVAVVVRRAGCARVTGTAESHLLFLF